MPIVVGSDAKAQSDIYSAITLAGAINTTCIVLAGARGANMPTAQRNRLEAAKSGGYIVGGVTAVPASKTVGRDMARIAGVDRWDTAQQVGAIAADADRANMLRPPAASASTKVTSAGAHIRGAEGWFSSNCASEVPIVVGSDAAAQSDIYSAITLAGVIGTNCIVLSGARNGEMPTTQRKRLEAAAPGGFIVGGEASVPAPKTAVRNMVRIAGANRWTTARLIGQHANSYADFDFDRTTLEGIFAENALRRAITVSMLREGIESGEFGVGEDDILRGPAGFEIDMGDCPSNWSNNTGITETQIRIGHTTAQSGNLAAYGYIANGWNNYLNWVNNNDPIVVNSAPRELTLIVKDDAYVASRTQEAVNEFIESENVFAITNLGSPNALSVYGQLNAECVPQPFVMSGHPAWGDPVNHPWTTGLQMSYSTEAVLWGTWIKNNLADKLPVKVAGLVMDNDFGLSYEFGFEEWANANPDVVSEFRPVRHDPAAPTLTNEMATVRAEGPDMFISMTAGAPCLNAIQEAGANGLIDDINDRGGALFTSSVCKTVANYLAPAGEAADDWWIVNGGAKNTTDPNYADEPFISWLNSNLEDGGLDPATSLYGTGYMYGYPYVEAVRIAADLPGGLNRTNFVLAVRSLSIYHPLILDGINAEFKGATDAYFIEGSDFSQFDAKAQSWDVVGDIVDLNGDTPNCAWSWDRCRR